MTLPRATTLALVAVLIGKPCGCGGGGGGPGGGNPPSNLPVITAVEPSVSDGLAWTNLSVTGRNLGATDDTLTLRLTARTGTPFALGTEATLDLPATLLSPTEIFAGVPFASCTVEVLVDVTALFDGGDVSTLAGAFRFEPQWKLLDPDGDAGDSFGQAVATSGDWVVVGALYDDENGQDSGSVYFYDSVVGTRQKVDVDDGAASDRLGSAVAIHGRWAVVGAREENAQGAGAGAAYVFQRVDGIGGDWQQTQKLFALDGAVDAQFGAAVAIRGEQLVVGAPGASHGAIIGAGAAYVFELDGALWVQQQKLRASDAAPNNDFGRSVEIAQNLVIVGAPFDDIDFDVDAGSAYVFTKDGASWPTTEHQKLVATTRGAGDRFGMAVSHAFNTTMVGAPRDDDQAPDAGSVYVFEAALGAWTEMERLLAPDGRAGDEFGSAVDGTTFNTVMGAPYADDGMPGAGSAYLFKWSETGWNLEAKLRAADVAASQYFGNFVGIDDRVVVGARGDAENGASAGAVYVH